MTESVLAESVLIAKKELVQKLLQKNILLPPSLILQLDLSSVSALHKRLNDPSLPQVSSSRDLIQVLRKDPKELEDEAAEGHGHTHTTQAASIIVDSDDEAVRQRQRMQKGDFRVAVLSDYQEKPRRREVGDFVSFFRERYTALEKILRFRQELQNVVSISRLTQRRGKETVAIIGMVIEKSAPTKNTQSIILTLEDLT